jgi:hypothetical protein
MIKQYLLVDIGQKIFLVFNSKREGNKENIVLQCRVDHAVVNEKGISYMCIPEKVINDKTKAVEKYTHYFRFRNCNIDTGMRKDGDYPVFTTKEVCIKWLKN